MDVNNCTDDVHISIYVPQFTETAIWQLERDGLYMRDFEGQQGQHLSFEESAFASVLESGVQGASIIWLFLSIVSFVVGVLLIRAVSFGVHIRAPCLSEIPTSRPKGRHGGARCFET